MTAIQATGGLELPRHVREAGRTMAYALLGVGYGLVYIVVVGGGLILGAILSPAWVGLPVMAKVARLAWNLAEGERRQANRLLEAHLPPVPRPPRTDWRGTLEQTGYGAFWRAFAMLMLRLPSSVAALVLGAAPIVLAAVLLVLAGEGFSGEDDRVVGPWQLGAVLAVGLCVLAAAVAVLALAAQDGIGWLLRALAQALLRSERTGEEPVREMLAERLGDRSLNIAYWLPDREVFVDDRGHRVDLPRSGSGRAWTAVEREGTRVAAIVHDSRSCATRGAGSSRPLTTPAARSSATCTTAPSSSSSRSRSTSACCARGSSRTRSWPRPSRSWPTSSPWRSPSCASWPAASTRPCSPTTGSPPPSTYSSSACRSPSSASLTWRSGFRRRSRPPRTSSSPRASPT
jgi:putative sensor protein